MEYDAHLQYFSAQYQVFTPSTSHMFRQSSPTFLVLQPPGPLGRVGNQPSSLKLSEVGCFIIYFFCSFPFSSLSSAPIGRRIQPVLSTTSKMMWLTSVNAGIYYAEPVAERGCIALRSIREAIYSLALLFFNRAREIIPGEYWARIANYVPSIHYSTRRAPHWFYRMNTAHRKQDSNGLERHKRR